MKFTCANKMKHYLAFLCLCLSTSTFGQVLDPITFSFASDSYADGPTFTSPGGDTIIANVPGLTLITDLNHDFAAGSVSVLANFRFRGTVYNYSVIPRAPGARWEHRWDVEGRFGFFVPGGPRIFTAEFSRATLTSISQSQFAAGRTLTLQDFKGVDNDLDFKPFTALFNLPGVPNFLRVRPFDLDVGENFAFTLTSVKPTLQLIPLYPNGEFVDSWTAEGSFSAGAVRDLPLP